MNLGNKIDNLIVDVNKSDISDVEISLIRDKMKEFEKALKDKSKPKTITISGSCHKMVKDFCSDNNLNIGDWVSRILMDEVDKKSKDLNYNIRRAHSVVYQDFIKGVDMGEDCILNETEEEASARIIRKYKGVINKSKKVFIKSNEFIDDAKVLLIGYDRLDGYGIYLVISEDFNTSSYLVADKLNHKNISKVPLNENIVEELTPVDINEAAKLVDFNK